jgi:hypothetical protein
MTTELAIELGILFLGLYLAFFKSYLTEKGKSAALKEDISGLTLEVEKIKSDFNKEQEILKTDLQRILSNELSYQQEERNAILTFHSIISEWIYSILEIGYGNYNKTNIDDLIAVRKNIACYYAKAGIAKSRIELLIDDADLVKYAREYYVSTLAFHHWTEMGFLSLQNNCERQRSLTDRFLIVIKEFEKNKEFAEEMAQDEEQLRIKAKELCDNYYSNRNEEYKKVLNPELDFEKKVKEYLKK